MPERPPQMPHWIMKLDNSRSPVFIFELVSERSELIQTFISAGKRDLEPLLHEAADELHLEAEQAQRVGGFMSQIWICGARSGHEQVLARVDPDRREPEIADVESDLRQVMEDSADALNLSVSKNIELWDFLCRAWFAGVNSSRTETVALAIEHGSDVAEEAQQWLDETEGR